MNPLTTSFAPAAAGATAPSSMSRTPLLPRNTAIALGVVALHVGGLWALQSGLLRRAVELVVPVEVLVEFIEPAQPIVTPPPPAPKVKPQPVQQAPRKPAPLPPAPVPVAIPDPTPAPDAPTGTTLPQPPAPPITAAVAPAPPAPAPAPPAPPAPPRIELPSSNADYLNNPRPAYPALSKRLGEQGKVVVRVFIETSGTASKAEIAQSSGFDRLDQTALDTVRRWRYVPGKRAGVPEAMWFNVPINFVLE